MSCKWNSLGEQECLNEASFLVYAGCTEGCVPAFFSPPLTDIVIPLTSLCLVEKSSHILSFFFGFPKDSKHFYITGNSEMAAKTRHRVGKCIADNFQCLCLLQSYKLLCWTTQRHGFGKSRIQGSMYPLRMQAPGFFKVQCQTCHSKIQHFSGIITGGLRYILGLRYERRM